MTVLITIHRPLFMPVHCSLGRHLSAHIEYRGGAVCTRPPWGFLIYGWLELPGGAASSRTYSKTLKSSCMLPCVQLSERQSGPIMMCIAFKNTCFTHGLSNTRTMCCVFLVLSRSVTKPGCVTGSPGRALKSGSFRTINGRGDETMLLLAESMHGNHAPLTEALHTSPGIHAQASMHVFDDHDLVTSSWHMYCTVQPRR